VRSSEKRNPKRPRRLNELQYINIMNVMKEQNPMCVPESCFERNHNAPPRMAPNNAAPNQSSVLIAVILIFINGAASLGASDEAFEAIWLVFGFVMRWGLRDIL
jgi:hypothetical protein